MDERGRRGRGRGRLRLGLRFGSAKDVPNCNAAAHSKRAVIYGEDEFDASKAGAEPMQIDWDHSTTTSGR